MKIKIIDVVLYPGTVIIWGVILEMDHTQLHLQSMLLLLF
jgi:hypothetical protein